MEKIVDYRKNYTDFKSYVNAENERVNNAYSSGLTIIKEFTINGHPGYIIKSSDSNTNKFYLYAYIEKDNFYLKQ